MRSLKKKHLGQGVTEYILITFFIGIAAITTFQYFGNTSQQQTAGLAIEIAGQDSGNVIPSVSNQNANTPGQPNNSPSTSSSSSGGSRGNNRSSDRADNTSQPLKHHRKISPPGGGILTNSI